MPRHLQLQFHGRRRLFCFAASRGHKKVSSVISGAENSKRVYFLLQLREQSERNDGAAACRVEHLQKLDGVLFLEYLPHQLRGIAQ